MKGKTKKTTSSKDSGNKVFDVRRPGKTSASATSRPVIVGHKPQVKDPMMAEHNDEERALLDSTQKVTVQPAPSTEPAESPTEHHNDDTNKPSSAPAVPSVDTHDEHEAQQAEPKAPEPAEAPTFASVAVTGAVEKPAPLDDVNAAPEIPTPSEDQTTADFLADTSISSPVEPHKPEAAATPHVSEKPTPSFGGGNVGVVYEEPAAPSQPTKPPGNIDPLPVLPDEPTPQSIIVAHHTPKAGKGKVFLTIFLLLIFAVIVFDVLLDAGFVVMENLPHTDFF